MFYKIKKLFKRNRTTITLQLDDLEYIIELLSHEDSVDTFAAGVLLKELTQYGKLREYY